MQIRIRSKKIFVSSLPWWRSWLEMRGWEGRNHTPSSRTGIPGDGRWQQHCRRLPRSLCDHVLQRGLAPRRRSGLLCSGLQWSHGGWRWGTLRTRGCCPQGSPGSPEVKGIIATIYLICILSAYHPRVLVDFRGCSTDNPGCPLSNSAVTWSIGVGWRCCEGDCWWCCCCNHICIWCCWCCWLFTLLILFTYIILLVLTIAIPIKSIYPRNKHTTASIFN